MRVSPRLAILFLFLAPFLYAQQSSADWVEALADPRVPDLVAQIEDEEASLSPLSPLSDKWFDRLETLGETLLEAGVHRSRVRYEEVSGYLYERGSWAGLPTERIRRYRRDSEHLFGALAEGPAERAVVAELLGASAEEVEQAEVTESSAVDALRRLEVELLTARSLSEKEERARRAASAVELVVQMREGVAGAAVPRWHLLAELFQTAGGTVEELQVSRKEEIDAITNDGDGGPTEMGVPEGELVSTFAALDPAALEISLRWDSQIAVGAATFYDRYRWSLAPVGDVATVGAVVYVIEERESALSRELHRRRLDARRQELSSSEERRASEELREQLLGEARSVLGKYEERAQKGDAEAQRWALLSVLSHPYAQALLFAEGDEQLRSRLNRRVESLYGEVDTRARELLGLVAKRHGVNEWSYEVTRIPDAFDRIVTVRLALQGDAEIGSDLGEQLFEAYYRAFNLVTNPEQNQELTGQGVAHWSMLHGQYFEPELLREEENRSLRDHLRPWFLRESRAEEAPVGFPFAYRGYQRIHFAQRDWLQSAGGRLPRRMRPEIAPSLYLAAEEAELFLSGDRSLYELERALGYLMNATLLPSHFGWAVTLEDAMSRHETVSQTETTTELLGRLSAEVERSEPEELADIAALLEARLRLLVLIEAFGLRDPEIGEEGVYDEWIESAVRLLSRDRWIADALELPARWLEQGLLSSEAADRFYRRLSSAGVEALATEVQRDE